MTHDAAPGIDPRFDPRFQRGYDGAPAAADRSAPPATEPATIDAPTVGDAASSPPRPTGGLRGPAVEAMGAATSTTAPAPTGAPAAATGALDPSGPPEPPEQTRFGATARLWIALGVSVGFIVVGSGVLWSLVSDAGYFMGRVGSTSEQALMQFVMNLTPGVVQAGVVGVVVVLVVWAMRPRRRRTDPAGTDAP